VTLRLACSSQSHDDVLTAGTLDLAAWMRFCAEELGLRAVELEDRHIGSPDAARLDALREASAACGLTVVNIALMNNFGLADPSRRGGEETRTREWMPAAQRLGSRFLRTFAGWPEGGREARWAGMVASLGAVCRDAEARGVRLVLENHNHGGFVQRAADVEAIFAAVHSPALGLLLDTGNYLDGLASITATAPLAWHVHAKFTEVDAAGRDPGIDHEAVVRVLRSAGYDGWLSVEYEGAEPSGTAVPRALAYLRRLIAS
jgi:sugar phosphate isomerase/epimerase